MYPETYTRLGIAVVGTVLVAGSITTVFVYDSVDNAGPSVLGALAGVLVVGVVLSLFPPYRRAGVVLIAGDVVAAVALAIWLVTLPFWLGGT